VALDKAGLKVTDIDLFENQRAFAAVGCASAVATWASVTTSVNVNGGHRPRPPRRMSGTRLALTSLLELRRRGGGTQR